ncbi:MAG: hypothetical protein IKC69_04865 [Clostridia bacterium]|nr:hypothetical protein [Clostridia bacterium]
MRFFTRLQDAIRRFMLGRYGTDRLNRHLILLWLLVAILNLGLKNLILSCIELIFCGITFFRMLSRNVLKRQEENRAYGALLQRLLRPLRRTAVRIRDRKTTRFFRCPSCSADIRMPRRIGKFKIRCTKCGHVFFKEFKK